MMNMICEVGDRRPPVPIADVVGLLRRSARATPGRTAVAHPDGNRTYAELLSRVDRWASVLRTSGSEPVVVVAEHDHVVPELYLGVMAAGHAVVPLSSRLPDEAVARLASAAGARIGILAPSAAHRLKSIAESASTTRWITDNEALGTLPPNIEVLPEGTAMISFTSGTTGAPKGVVLSHLSLVVHALTASLCFRVFAGGVHINPMPLAHYAGASRVVLAVADSGTHVIVPEFSPEEVSNAALHWGGTHLIIAPTMAADLLASPSAQEALSGLTLVYGTAPMPMRLARDLVEQFRCNIVNGYGLTESSGLATALGPASHRHAIATGDEELLGSVGQPVPGIELRVVDGSSRDVDPGAIGEIALRGTKLSSGYLNNPAETTARFRDDGWLLTGDQGRLLPGENLVLLGRVDDMIISGGLNVQPQEIESQVLLHASVTECAVFSTPSQRWGQEIRLAVVPKDPAAFDVDALRLFLRGQIDPFKVPKAVYIVERLPRNNVGKLQRSALQGIATQYSSQ